MPEPNWIFIVAMVSFASALWFATLAMDRTRRDQVKQVLPLEPQDRP
ncbi:hypothetical protein [Stappia sp.]